MCRAPRTPQRAVQPGARRAEVQRHWLAGCQEPWAGPTAGGEAQCLLGDPELVLCEHCESQAPLTRGHRHEQVCAWGAGRHPRRELVVDQRARGAVPLTSRPAVPGQCVCVKRTNSYEDLWMPRSEASGPVSAEHPSSLLRPLSSLLPPWGPAPRVELSPSAVETCHPERCAPLSRHPASLSLRPSAVSGHSPPRRAALSPTCSVLSRPEKAMTSITRWNFCHIWAGL